MATQPEVDTMPTQERPWQVSGVRGRIISGKREYIYHGIGPDGFEIAAVWFDTRTGAGLKDAHWIVRACNSYGSLVDELRALVTAVTFADPPKKFNGVLCHEARVPIAFIDGAKAALAKADPRP